MTGPKPQPRAESVALAVSELLIRGNGVDNNPGSGTGSCLRPRLRNNQRSNKCLSYGRVSPCDPAPTRPSFLREISKLSQINLSRLSHPNKCSYSVLSAHDDNEQESPQEVSWKFFFLHAFLRGLDIIRWPDALRNFLKYLWLVCVRSIFFTSVVCSL